MENVDTALKTALAPFNVDLESNIYQGAAKKYITYNYTTIPMDFSDDEPERERYLVQVHIFAPLNKNINVLVRDIKLALFAAGFTYPESVNASTADERHVVLETEAAVEVDYGEF